MIRTMPAPGIRGRLERMSADILAARARLLHGQGLGTAAYLMATLAVEKYRANDQHLDADDLAADLLRPELA